MLYLIAIGTSKAWQRVAQGVICGAESVVLAAAHLRSGLLNAETNWSSPALLPAALAGMALGHRQQDPMDQDLFPKVTLVVLIVAGGNLVRKGLMGGRDVECPRSPASVR